MVATDETGQITEIMAQLFPGYENFQVHSVTPSIYGERDNPVVSFMIVCNDEAVQDFSRGEEIYVEVITSLEENKNGSGYDLHMRFEFIFPLFKLQFFTAVEGDNREQQKHFAEVLNKVDKFVIWLVDKEKNLVSVLQTGWDFESNKKVLEKLLQE